MTLVAENLSQITHGSVSVVVPFFNGNRYLQDALESIDKNKTFVKEVLIVVDHGSHKPIFKNEFSFPVYVISNKSKYSGAGMARAEGFNIATGHYVSFLDCDDVWHSGKLKKQISMMQKQNLAFSFHGFKHFSSESNKTYLPIIPKGKFNMSNFLSKQFTIPCLTVMVDKTKVTSIIGNKLKKRNDYKMWHDLIIFLDKNNFNWKGLDFLGASHRLHNQSLTSSRFSSALHYFIFLNTCNLKISCKVYYFICYAYRAIGTR